MNARLAAIGAAVADGACAVVVLDGAGWHRSKGLVVPDNIVLLPLPPYSPESKPMETVIQFLRGQPLVEPCVRQRGRREGRVSRGLGMAAVVFRADSIAHAARMGLLPKSPRVNLPDG